MMTFLIVVVSLLGYGVGMGLIYTASIYQGWGRDGVNDSGAQVASVFWPLAIIVIVAVATHKTLHKALTAKQQRQAKLEAERERQQKLLEEHGLDLEP